MPHVHTVGPGPNITKPCPICSWPLRRMGGRLVCVTPGCKHSEPLAVSIKLREQGQPMLPGLEE